MSTYYVPSIEKNTNMFKAKFLASRRSQNSDLHLGDCYCQYGHLPMPQFICSAILCIIHTNEPCNLARDKGNKANGA